MRTARSVTMAAMPPRLAAAALALVAGAAVTSMAGCTLTEAPDPVMESKVPPSPDVVKDLVGPGCDAYVRAHPSGRGSVAALAKQSAAAAIASHPDLTQFARAVDGKLNPGVDLTAAFSGGRFTIFAPADSAFDKLPPAALNALSEPDSTSALTDLLRSHVVRGERTPAKLSGSLETLDGDPIAVVAKGDRIRIDGQANVICGGLHTANATLYVIDGILMPPVTEASPSPTDDAGDAHSATKPSATDRE